MRWKHESIADRAIRKLCKEEIGIRGCYLIESLGRQALDDGFKRGLSLTKEDVLLVKDAYMKVVGVELDNGWGNGLPLAGQRARFIGYEIENACLYYSLEYPDIFPADVSGLSERAQLYSQYLDICFIMRQYSFARSAEKKYEEPENPAPTSTKQNNKIVSQKLLCSDWRR